MGTVLETFDPHHDPGVGNGHQITVVGGRLVGADDGATQVIESFRLRHPGTADPQLADLMDGWSNGWCSVRRVPG